MDKVEPVSFGDFLCEEYGLARECVHRFMCFDAAEAGVFVSQIAEAGHQHPLERVLTPVVQFPPFITEGFEPLFSFL